MSAQPCEAMHGATRSQSFFFRHCSQQRPTHRCLASRTSLFHSLQTPTDGVGASVRCLTPSQIALQWTPCGCGCDGYHRPFEGAPSRPLSISILVIPSRRARTGPVQAGSFRHTDAPACCVLGDEQLTLPTHCASGQLWRDARRSAAASRPYALCVA